MIPRITYIGEVPLLFSKKTQGRFIQRICRDSLIVIDLQNIMVMLISDMCMISFLL